MKKRAVFRWLLLAPLGLLLAFLLISSGFALETRQAAQKLAEDPGAYGHPSGYTAFLTVPAGLLVFIVLSVTGIVKAVKGARHNKRLRRAEEESGQRLY